MNPYLLRETNVNRTFEHIMKHGVEIISFHKSQILKHKCVHFNAEAIPHFQSRIFVTSAAAHTKVRGPRCLLPSAHIEQPQEEISM